MMPRAGGCAAGVVGRPASRLIGVLLVASLVVACFGDRASPGADGPADGSPTSPVSPGTSPATPSLPPGTQAPSPDQDEFVNPVIRGQSFADPFVLRAGGTYYAYATTDGIRHISIARSNDLIEWEQLDDALPAFPQYISGDTWAPEVYRISDRFVMYYTGRAWRLQRPDGTGPQCIGLAVADRPEGPFVDEREEPLVCQPELGGTIDATVLEDVDGTRYLVYKNDGNCCAQLTRFYARRLSEDGLSVVGEEADLGLSNDSFWEGRVIEAPTSLVHDDTYYLFFSANDFAGPDYAVGYATASAPLGPYQDAEENPILTTVPGALGPGHQAIVADDDGDPWMVYHAWDAGLIYRQMWIDRLVFEDGRPVVEGPTTDTQHRP
jgi:beta-xylosidase